MLIWTPAVLPSDEAERVSFSVRIPRAAVSDDAERSCTRWWEDEEEEDDAGLFSECVCVCVWRVSALWSDGLRSVRARVCVCVCVCV